MTYTNIIFKKRYVQNNNDDYLVQLKNLTPLNLFA